VAVKGKGDDEMSSTTTKRLALSERSDRRVVRAEFSVDCSRTHAHA